MELTLNNSREMNLKNFKKELKELLKKHNAALGVDIDGDTFGINVNGFIVIDCKNDKKKAPWVVARF